MSAADGRSAPPTPARTERPHPASPFIRGWLILVAILIGVGRELLPDGSRGGTDVRLSWVLPVLGGAVLLAALAGFVSWYFTHFVIDDDEFRVETGALFTRSTRVSLERVQSVDVIQPMAARLFGLVELRIEAGSGDSAIKLRYLTRSKADRLRTYLLARAHGDRRPASTEAGPPPSAFTDLGSDATPLVRVGSGRIVGSFLLSSELLGPGLVVGALFVVGYLFQVTSFLLPALIPLLIGTATMISRRVINMFHFTLSDSVHGFRVVRGLTNLTSQSVPVSRIQGITVSQSLLWRPFGWYRVDVDVLGYGSGESENNRSEATSVLLPVADRDQVRLALARALPGVALDQIPLHRPPARARWLRWFDFWTLRHGWNEVVVVTQHGWLTWVRDVVPHVKTQSVRIEQGPLQRLVRLADVHFDTTRGPVNAIARQLDPAVARELAVAQLDRARAAAETLVRPSRSNRAAVDAGLEADSGPVSAR